MINLHVKMKDVSYYLVRVCMHVHALASFSFLVVFYQINSIFFLDDVVQKLKYGAYICSSLL